MHYNINLFRSYAHLQLVSTWSASFFYIRFRHLESETRYQSGNPLPNLFWEVFELPISALFGLADWPPIWWLPLAQDQCKLILYWPELREIGSAIGWIRRSKEASDWSRFGTITNHHDKKLGEILDIPSNSFNYDVKTFYVLNIRVNYVHFRMKTHEIDRWGIKSADCRARPAI